MSVSVDNDNEPFACNYPIYFVCGSVFRFEFYGGDVRGCPISVQSSKRLGTQQKSEMPKADEVILVTKDISYFPRTLISICLV